MVHSISYQTFFVQAFKIVVDSWKFTMLLLHILWYDWPIFMISGSNQQLQQQLEYTLLKPDCHSWWISKMQSGRKGTLEERYAIKFFFKLGKNATEMYGMIQTAFQPSCMNLASVFECHKRFKEGKESVRDYERCGRSKKSEHQSWLAKGLGLGLLCLGFKGVQEEIPSEEASTLQIGSVPFPPGQCTSQQLHPCHRLFDQNGHQDSSSPSLESRPCSLWLLVFPKLWVCCFETTEEMKEAVTKVIDTLTQEDFHGVFQKLLELYNKCIAAGGDYFKGDSSFMCVLSIKVPIRKKSENLFNDPRI